MKVILTTLLIFWSLVIVSITAVGVAPYYFYQKALTGKLNNEWFDLDNYNEKLLTPADKEVVKINKNENNLVWNKFHFQDFLIPLPVKNPLYLVSPVLDYKANKTQMGLELYFPSGTSISKILFVKQIQFPSALLSQKLFKIPVVKNTITKVPNDQLWKDIFSKKLGPWKISYNKMPYNLYLLQIRQILFPKNFLEYKLVEDDENTAIIKIESENKDYETEVILKKVNNTIYSYVLLTRKKIPESISFRSKFLKEVKYRSGNRSLSNYIYREFQALDYQDKIDHIGMLYLFSAWSHNTNIKDYIEQMVYYLERGKNNEKQLMPVYEYAVKKWGTTFSDRYVEGLTNDQIKLKRSIELEKKEKFKKLEQARVQENIPAVKELSEKEKIKLRLQKAKKNKKKSKLNRMQIN